MRIKQQMDPNASRELVLYANNDETVYFKAIMPTVKMLSKKYKKDIFDRQLAIKAFESVAKFAADKYKKDFSYAEYVFNPATRTCAARQLLDYYMEDITIQEV